MYHAQFRCAVSLYRHPRGRCCIHPADPLPPVFAVPTQERDALIALYNATDGPNWRNSDGWLSEPGTECSWYGVICSNDRVTGLGLSENQLIGSMPPKLGQ